MYQVWRQNEFANEWTLHQCEDLTEVKEEVLTSIKNNCDYMVTQQMEVSVIVEVKEPPAIPEFPRAPREPKVRPERKKEDKSEATESGPAEDPGPGGPGNRSI